MQNKLQELTDRLYNEGLSKGKEEGEQILSSARKEAEEIVAQARKEAESIILKAQKEAADYKTKVEGDLKMASSQCLQATRKDIENVVITRISDEKVASALKDADFLKEIIKAVAGKFSADQAQDIQLVLPESLKDNLGAFVEGELSKSLSKGVEASFSKKVAGGFTIGPKDGSYFVNFTDESFKTLIGEYLRPVTKKLLFG